MSLKRPVTLAQARRWPAAAKRRESFCARMGGMREKLTSDRVARDPRSAINRALAAWDCDEPEGLERKHVSRGIRPMKITRKMVGAEARKMPPKKNPDAVRKIGKFNVRYIAGSTPKIEFYDSRYTEGFTPLGQFVTRYYARDLVQAPSGPLALDVGIPEWKLTAAEFEKVRAMISRSGDFGPILNPARKPARTKNPAREKLARIMVADDKTGEKRIQTVPYDFAIKAYIGPVQHDFFVRSEGATLVVNEKSTGLRVGAVPYMKRYATMNDREAAKGFLAETVQRVGPEKFRAAIAKAPKIA
jgi:hypothetical protein